MKTVVLESLFDEVAGLQACNFIKKETQTQVLSCEFWEILENTFFSQNTLLLLLNRRSLY